MPGKRKLTNQVKAIQYFIEQGDVDMVFTIIKNIPQLTDKKKVEIQNELHNFFSDFEDTNDTHFTTRAGKCKGCIKGAAGFMYTGNVSKQNRALVFQQKDGNIQAIRNCAGFVFKKTAKLKKKPKPVKAKVKKKD